MTVKSDRPLALGFAELAFFSITALVADAMVKAAGVHLLGIETTGNQNLLVRIEGEVSAVEAALVAADERARQLGGSAVTHCLARPEAALTPLLHFPNAPESALRRARPVSAGRFPSTQRQTDERKRTSSESSKHKA